MKTNEKLIMHFSCPVSLVSFFRGRHNMPYKTVYSVDENELSAASIKLYPNPITDILKLEVKDIDIVNISIEIVNVNGQRIYFRQYNQAAQFECSIDVSDYPKGIYFVKVQNAKETKVGKVIVC